MKWRNKWILGMLCSYLLFGVASILIPEMAARGLDGLAAVGAAGGTFVIIGSIAILVSLCSLTLMILWWRTLSSQMRFIGVIPVILSCVVLLALSIAIEAKSDNNTRFPQITSKEDETINTTPVDLSKSKIIIPETKN